MQCGNGPDFTMERLPLIHIGYVKTGSTWIQNSYFGSENSPFLSLAPPCKTVSNIVSPHCLDPVPDEFVCEIRKKMVSAYKNGKIPLLSSERLSGNPISGGFDSLLIAERLKKICDDAKILIVVREQASMILSCYKQYIRECGVGSLKKYVNPPNDAKLPMFHMSFFNFHLLVRKYQKLFGEEKVKVLCYEYLRENPVAFCNSVARFSGAPEIESVPVTHVNTALRNSTIVARSYTNWLFCRARTNVHAPFDAKWVGNILNGASKYVPGIIDKKLGEKLKRSAEEVSSGRFAETNRMLQEITGLDLSRYGYEV